MRKNLVALLLFGMLETTAQASFHLWKIQEVYTNFSGTVQFVEFFTSASGQQFLSGHTLASTGATTFTFPSDLPLNSPLAGHPNTASTTANMTFLVGTSNLTSLYGVVPDYIIPANFLTAGGINVLNFQAGTDSVNLSNLPTDGVQSLNAFISNSAPDAFSINTFATPMNFRGETFTVPEPSVTWLLLTAALGLAVRPCLKHQCGRFAGSRR